MWTSSIHLLSPKSLLVFCWSLRKHRWCCVHLESRDETMTDTNFLMIFVYTHPSPTSLILISMILFSSLQIPDPISWCVCTLLGLLPPLLLDASSSLLSNLMHSIILLLFLELNGKLLMLVTSGWGFKRETKELQSVNDGGRLQGRGREKTDMTESKWRSKWTKHVV